MFTNNVT